MQGFAEKKKEGHKLLETSAEEKKQQRHGAIAPSMSEGPMILKDSQSIEQQARAQFERSVKIELDAMKKRAMLKKKLKEGKKKGKKGRRRKGKKKDEKKD